MTPEGFPRHRVPFIGTNHMVASGHYLAAQAGFRMLEDGGNAIDAGVASGIAINVALPHLTSFAGVAPIILYLADRREVLTISGLGRWPKAANLDDYMKRYGGEIPLAMPRSVVPAACDAWITALQLYGTMTFEQVVSPSLELAEKGVPTSYNTSGGIKRYKENVENHPGTVELFMPGGKPLQHGDVFVQKDLAQVFRQMIEVERANAYGGREGAMRAARDFFYKGEVAEKMVRFCQENNGLLTMQDFADFSVKVEKPEVGTYGDYTIYTCGPWCQGPALIEVLHILEGLDLQGMGHNSAQYVHSLVEATKLAFADREAYYGDSDFVDVPMAGLNSKEYAAARREAIDPGRTRLELPPAGNPWPYRGKGIIQRPAPIVPDSGLPVPDTSYTCTVDRWGNAFSSTPSDGFTHTPIVPGLGLIISSRGGQSWLDPAHPSCLGPWKRPRLTPSPAMVLKNGDLCMPFGTPSDDMQVQAMAQMFLSMFEFGLDPQQAVEVPRFRSNAYPNTSWPHSYEPGQLVLEGHIGKEVGGALAKLGHKIEWWNGMNMATGDLCGILVDRERGVLLGGADPRWDSYTLGW